MLSKRIIIFSSALILILIMASMVFYIAVKESCNRYLRKTFLTNENGISYTLRYKSWDFNARNGIVTMLFFVDHMSFPGDPQYDAGVQWRLVGGNPYLVRLVKLTD